MSDASKRPVLWSTLEEYEGDPEVLARQGGGDWNTKPKGFAEKLENLQLPELQMRRRTFLKMGGFAAVLATAAGCEKPAEKILPYITAPEETTPGIPAFYASTCGACAAGCAILVKTYESHPIKLEGNPAGTVNKGTLCTRGQASLIDLYDPDRLQKPVVVATKGTAPWDDLDKDIAAKLKAAGGRAVLLTGTINGIARTALVGELQKTFPGLRHVVYDAFSEDEATAARALVFGTRERPRIHFDKSKVTVLIGGDPMVDSASPLEAQSGIGQSRKIREEGGKKTMGRLYAFEPLATMSGMNADYRYAVRATQLGSIAIAIASQLQADGHSEMSGMPSLRADVAGTETSAGLPKGTIKRIADDLWANRGAAVAYTGGMIGRTGDSLAAHVAVNLINVMIGAEGTVIDSSRPSLQSQGSVAAMIELIADMNNGNVDVLLVEGTNPAYSLPAGVLTTAFAKVKTKVSFSAHQDETASLCDVILPGVHFLENWGDAEPYAGHHSIMQPTIGKLWKETRSFEESLIALMRAAGSHDFDTTVPPAKEGDQPTVRATTWHEFLMKTWEEKVFKAGGFVAPSFQEFWFQTLRQGAIELPAPRAAKGSGDLAKAAATIAEHSAKGSATLELVTYALPNTADGRQSNNPWLLELPDPVSRVCWDNFVALAPSTAKAGGYRDGDIVELTADGAKVKGPIRIHPGQHPNTVAIGTGWGRTGAGAVGNGEGFNAFALGRIANMGVAYSGAEAALKKTGDHVRIADVQGHNFMKVNPYDEHEHDRPLLQATSLDLYNKSEEAPQAVHHIPYWKKGDPEPDFWRTKDFHYVKNKWAMSIDLNACIGCGACMVACQAENNIPTVGKREVLIGREMHWIRIDRYYKGDPDNPEFVRQPILCQQCDNAPCETVCPVLATVHTDDGLNQQVYNRCVGTRYCANNCPYKVRRFNFYNYGKFRKGPHDELEAGAPNEIAETPLVLALNPEVTVRSKGIMEKCTFCIQRLRSAKENGKRLGRSVQESEVRTACQQTCPSQAIVFGDALNPEHEIAKLREAEHGKRGYGVLEEMNVRPNILYLAQVWNRETKEWDVDYEKANAHGPGHHEGDPHETGHEAPAHGASEHDDHEPEHHPEAAGSGKGTEE